MKPKRFRFHSTPLFGTPLCYGAPVFAGLVVFLTGLNSDAKDILRPNAGAGGGAAPAAAGGGAALTRAATEAARANSQDILRRTGQTLDAMRAMQAAARAAAQAGPDNLGPNLPAVPNGLRPGGLNPAADAATNPASWSGAGQPVETVSGENVNVTVRQTTQQALLQWQTLNVGKKTTLTFDQSAGGANTGQWIAFNQVNDPSGNPTQILGNIKADGQVYLINRNGVIFGGSSQVNARGLTVSSLPINTNLVSQGLLNNPDGQFLFTGLDVPAGINGTGSFTPGKPLTSDGKYGNVVVQKGAILESPTNSAKVGGRISLVGPNVINQGSILTPDGQAILAAGLQVGFDSHASSDPSLRGLDVFVGAVADPIAGLYTGAATQDGIVEAARGSITIAGREVSQNGGLVSTTSVSLNGRIDLQAQFNAFSNRATSNPRGDLFLFRDTGTVSHGAGSVISILPEYASLETTIGTELSLRSQINSIGKAIRVGQGSILLAPNASVNLAGGSWLFENRSATPISTFVQVGGQVYLESGATINVAGSIAVPVPVSQNVVSVELRSAELANSPLQRLGILRNATVQVDIRESGNGWIGTPLADVSGFANLIQKSVGQLTVSGGNVSVTAGDSVVMQQGSTIDVSGGSILFEAGTVRTTQLISGGRLVDIGKATSDLVYDGIYDGKFIETNSKFQVRNVYHSPLARDGSRYEAASTQGGAGGKLTISAPSMALDGNLLGKTIAGEQQRQTPPTRSSLTLSFLARDRRYASLPLYSPTPPRVVFSPDVRQDPAAPFELDSNGIPVSLGANRLETVFLSPDLLQKSGFGELTINNNDGEIIIPHGVVVEASAGGSITLAAANIFVDGGIIARGGKLSFNSYNVSLDAQNLADNTTGNSLPVADPGRGLFQLGSSGVVSTSGLLLDDRANGNSAGLLPLFPNGGSISVNAYSAVLARGGQLDVSGGATVSAKGKITYGNAGSLSISAGRDLNIEELLGGRLLLGATLSGFSGARSGSISIQAPAIQIGGSSSNSAVTLLDQDFFNRGGFGAFSMTGIGLSSGTPGEFVTGLYIAPEARIHPVVSSLTADIKKGNFSLSEIIREEGVRTPSSLFFNAQGATNSFAGVLLGRGDVILAEGALILTDAKGEVAFKGDTVTLSGSVIAPGGSISAGGASRFPSDDPNLLRPTTLIGKSAFLSAAGKTVLIENPYGRREGQVVAGGGISITGNIVAERGAIFDVSGASGVLDLLATARSLDPAPVKSLTRNLYSPAEIHSDGGRISLSGSRMLYSDALLIGRAGGTSAIGGSVSVSSGRFVAAGAAFNTAETNLVVRQDGSLVPDDFVSKGPGTAFMDSSGSLLPGIGNFTVSSFSSGGFDSLSLNGNVRFEGDVTLFTPGSLRVSSGGVVSANGNVTLAAGYVNLGQAFSAPALASDPVILFSQTDTAGSITPYNFAPTFGTGTIKIEGDLIDIGNLSLQGIGSAHFNAERGDIRGNGTLSAAGALELKSGQIYPTTAGRFSIFAYDFMSSGQSMAGSVSIRGGVSRQLPLSAGGTLEIYSSQIYQAGTLRAPIGRIVLGWDGTGAQPVDPIAGNNVAKPTTGFLTLGSTSLTSVSAVDSLSGAGTLIPYGISLNGSSWIDPAGVDITVSGIPSKSVNLSAVNLVTENSSSIDIGGGGDLYAFRWVSGSGGTVDLLSSSTSFAVIPGYGFNYSPYAPFNTSAAATNLDGQPGYTNSTLKVGDKVTFAASGNLPAGTYTLLPARYALLPGALLVTPKSGSPTRTANAADGTSMVAGYRSNDLDASRTGRTVITRFEVANAGVVRARAEYQDFFASTVLREAAISREFLIPRLPVDAGYLSFSSTTNMSLRGNVISAAPMTGRGSVIDINSSSDILINSSGLAGSATGLVLSAQTLNSFGAETLLIGGLRNFGSQGVTVTANSNNVTLDNAGVPLTGRDVILVSREKLTLAGNSEISISEDNVALDTLLVGNSDVSGSGNGALVRVSANATGQVYRYGIGSSTLTELGMGSGVLLAGGSIVLDSSAGNSLSQSARLIADDLFLNSGQISISMNNPGGLNPTTGLVLAGDALASLQNSARRLSLLSYSTMDVYGTGIVGSQAFESLSLQASAIRGFNSGGGSVTFSAANLLLGNRAASVTPVPLAGPLLGTLNFEAGRITFGANSMGLDGYAQTNFIATGGMLTSGQGSLDATGNLNLITPLLTGTSASKYAIRSAGGLLLIRPVGAGPSITADGFGSDLTLQGATVRVNGDITLPSGSLTLHATSGDLTLGDSASAVLNLAGTATTFVDTIRYSSGGTVKLYSDTGSVRVGAAAGINVSALDGGGDAGAILVKAPGGIFDLAGHITATAGGSGDKGEFALDAGSIVGGSLASLDAILNAGSFTHSRDYRIRAGNVNIDGYANSHIYRVSSDTGNIVVSGNIDASGVTGGTVDLKANGSLTLVAGAVLNASGGGFDSAGKGGAVTLEAGNQRNGVSSTTAVLDLQAGSFINLAVAAADSGSESRGKFTGTLHLRAPRNAANTDLQVNAIGSSIVGASSILVEGVRLYGLTGSGVITSAVQTSIKNDATAYLGAAGTTTAGYTAMLGRLTASNPGLDLILAPGAEIYNLNGSLTLGSTSSTATSDWDLSSFRFGPRSVAGVLTLRASENLSFFNAISDGFSGGSSLWLAPLMAYNPLLPANAQSWSYRFTAGADLSAASFREVKGLNELGATSGSLLLGKDRGASTATGAANATTASIIGNAFQVIRTGSGDIDVNAGRSIQLLNVFSSIYTAGTQVADPTKVVTAGDFVIPNLANIPGLTQGDLGTPQQQYPAQYSMAGGNLTLRAGANIERKTRNNSGLIDDSSRQLPNNWLYRRGHIGPDGEYGELDLKRTGVSVFTDPAASTSWWVDFSNFFQSVGALGGGNVSLDAGVNVSNVDAVAPTNARAAIGRPSADTLVELGGGDVHVRAGNDISGGIYYVERGNGSLEAGGSITTNATRSPSAGIVSNLNNPVYTDSRAWIPTLLFAGNAKFDISARGDLLIGPTYNPFLLPTGLNNRFWYKSYFSTFNADAGTTITSLGGNITVRNAITFGNSNVPVSVLQGWLTTQNLLANSNASAARSQPWLRLGETSVTAFQPVLSLAAPTLKLSALSGSINLAGSLNLSPSATGQLELVAAGGISALQPTGLSTGIVPGKSTVVWSASTLNLSDANPASVPGSLSPLSYFGIVGNDRAANVTTSSSFLDPLRVLFVESGSYTGDNATTQARQGRHAAGLLHRDDKEPVRLYALGGDISGLTLFTPKISRLFASRDITDVAFYIQNLLAGDLSIVSAGRNLVPYNSNSQARAQALSVGNAVAIGQTPLAGDLQISGPGTMQVLAGRNLDLGIGAGNIDGTGAGIISIGNFRNPYLPANGASIVVGAGVNTAPSLGASEINFSAFISKYVLTPEGLKYLDEIAPGVDLAAENKEEQSRLALEVFYSILRDTGRDFNNPDSPGFGNYSTGIDAIATLFGDVSQWNGEVLTQSRNIRTRSGGDIRIFSPGGGIALADTSTTQTSTPPGIITEAGGRVSLFTDQDVSIGIGRIFTLRGGDIVIWSSRGDIAAGSSSRTVQSAPPTRVIVDPQSASVETDLAGLATGGGIGVLATVAGVPAGDVDLIAPTGVIDAGDAGIRVTGNINLAAVQVVNAGNISAGGSSTGAPSSAVSAPSISTVTSASNASAAASSTIANTEKQQTAAEMKPAEEALSIITVEVIGYGGGETEEDEDGNQEAN